MRMRLSTLSLVALVVSQAAFAGDVAVQFTDEVFEFDHAHPAAGYLLGNLKHPNHATVIAIDIKWKDDQGYIAEAMALALAALNTPCQNLEIDGYHAALVIKTGAAEEHFDG